MTNLWRTQAQCFSHRETTGDHICFSTFVEGVRHYGTCVDHDHYAEYLLSDRPGAKHANELLWTSSRGFVDLDAPCTLQELGKTEADFIAGFNTILIEQHAKHLGVTLKPNDLLWSCSSRPGKTSYHITIQDSSHFWPANARATMKSFFGYVETACLDTPGYNFFTEADGQYTQRAVIDLAVYSKNRTWRSTGCSKPGVEVPFLPVHGRLCHSQIVNHMLTISDEAKSPFTMKSKCKIPRNTVNLHKTIWSDLAQQYGCTFVKTQGSLVMLKNNGPRVCPNGGETNTSDNAFFVLKNRGGSVHYGCHNSDCCGKLLKIHEFHSSAPYEFYEDYRTIINDKTATKEDVETYLCNTVHLVERPEDPFFVTFSKRSLPSFDYRLNFREVNQSKKLFEGNCAISIIDPTREKPVKFNHVLRGLVEQRKIKTYSDAVWVPFNKACPRVSSDKLNLFTGFAMQQVPSSGVDFTKTHLYDLLHRLCGHKRKSIDYLLDFLADKLQRPYIKHPIALCFINSKEGTGKGSFGKFLEKLFACGRNTYVSFNDLESFKNSFNAVQAYAQFICLEEVSATRGGLRSYNGFLKDKISSTTMLMEAKCKERVQIPWYANVLIFSNDFNVMSCSRNDRRLAFFTSDNSKANNREYFTQIYKELDDLNVMRAAFDFFTERDTSNFNYRAIPHSEIKQKLVRCSERNADKFHRHLMRTLGATEVHTLRESELYELYRDYAHGFGLTNISNRHNMISTLELHLPFIRKIEDPVEHSYTFTESDRQRFLRMIGL